MVRHVLHRVDRIPPDYDFEEYNACAAAGGSDCEAAAEACMETVQAIRKIKRSGTLGRRLY